MNKELLLQVISEAIDKGAKFSLHLLQYDNELNPISKETAYELASKFQNAVDSDVMGKAIHENVCENFIVSVDQFHGVFSHSPKPYLWEDVNLDGGADEIAI